MMIASIREETNMPITQIHMSDQDHLGRIATLMDGREAHHMHQNRPSKSQEVTIASVTWKGVDGVMHIGRVQAT